MESKSFIKVSTSTEFIHCWPEAPKEVDFLRHRHRHQLIVNAALAVYHDDRELEFIMVKRAITEFIEDCKYGWPDRISCEQVGQEVAEFLIVKYGAREMTIEVLEDNENGSILIIQ